MPLNGRQAAKASMARELKRAGLTPRTAHDHAPGLERSDPIADLNKALADKCRADREAQAEGIGKDGGRALALSTMRSLINARS